MAAQNQDQRMMHLNLFLFGCGHHRAAWRHPDSAVEQMGDIRYYERLAQTAERGKLDAVFFADGQSTGNVADGSYWFLEPLTAMAAMSRATDRIGFISTVSSTFFTPFHAARMMASLDHISNGRMGWNVVTSMFDVEARIHKLLGPAITFGVGLRMKITAPSIWRIRSPLLMEL